MLPQGWAFWLFYSSDLTLSSQGPSEGGTVVILIAQVDKLMDETNEVTWPQVRVQAHVTPGLRPLITSWRTARVHRKAITSYVGNAGTFSLCCRQSGEGGRNVTGNWGTWVLLGDSAAGWLRDLSPLGIFIIIISILEMR